MFNVKIKNYTKKKQKPTTAHLCFYSTLRVGGGCAFI